MFAAVLPTRIATAVLATVLALTGAEIALRLWQSPQSAPGAGDQLRWAEHPFLPYIGRPHADYVATWSDAEGRSGTEHYRLNDYGFRTWDFPRRKPEGQYVIVAFGGSTTMGFHAADNAATWPEQLGAMLAQRYPERDIRAYNLGLDMATTAFSVVNMALFATHLDPDLVVVYQGYNDFSAMGWADQRWDHSHFYRDLDVDEVLGQHRRQGTGFGRSLLWNLVKNARPGVPRIDNLADWTTYPRRDGPDRLDGIDDTLANLRTIDSLARGVGAHTLMSTFQFRDPSVDSVGFNDRLRGFFGSLEIAWVDQDALLPDADPELQVDECHFTPEGNTRLARNFFDAVVERGWLEDDPAQGAAAPSSAKRSDR
jgi:lysophospholipase L1-like esterase